jgi:hypothetical protein
MEGRMKKIVLISLLFFSVFLLSIGCNGKDNRLADSITIQQYRFYYNGEPTTSTLTLPQELNDAQWALIKNSCEQTGYSLDSYVGQNITSIKYSIIETYLNEPLYLWVLEKNQITICAYLSVRENSTAAPGVFALNNPNVK